MTPPEGLAGSSGELQDTSEASDAYHRTPLNRRHCQDRLTCGGVTSGILAVEEARALVFCLQQLGVNWELGLGLQSLTGVGIQRVQAVCAVCTLCATWDTCVLEAGSGTTQRKQNRQI